MKRSLLIFAVLLTLSLTGCPQAQPPDTTYHSNTPKEDCYLCAGKIEDIKPYVWGQDNLALISLNTFELQPLEINRYDRLTHQPIEEYTGVFSLGRGGSESGGFSAEIMLDCDRGYATSTLRFNDDETLDIEKAAGFLCEDCLNEILSQDLEECFGVGMIHLATKEIFVLQECYTGFGLGDFYVDCNLMEGKGWSPRWMDLLVFYCPVRYGETGAEME